MRMRIYCIINNYYYTQEFTLFMKSEAPCLLCTGFEYVAAYRVMLNASTTEATAGEEVTFFCSAVNITDTFSRWEINERVYDVTHLPSGFVATGLSLQIIFEGILNVRCFFDILTSTGVVSEYSNRVTVTGETRGKLENGKI